MFYVDSQRTVTRRDSSLIVPERIRLSHVGDEGLSTARAQSTARLCSESTLSLIVRPKGSVQKELVTMLFESMLDTIVDSWEVIVQQKAEESTPNMDFGKTASELTFSKKKGKGKETAAKISKSKRSRSKMEDLSDSGQVDGYQSWWSAPDERALVRFRNGNLYEGNISMKCMHGEGRFQWADGTVYFGQFKDNEINGKGMIQWKDDTWYEGEFAGNLRHGHGLYVNSRAQRSYAGGWHLATKHGKGVIYYSKTFKNSYDGEWVHFYRGTWKNGVMSGCGIYIWDAYYNNTMSLPSISAFRGQWNNGKRNGYGVLNLGLGQGSHYKGEFKDNMKHGSGKFVTNNGLIIQHKKLFIDDNLGPEDDDYAQNFRDSKYPEIREPYTFDICDSTVGLIYHIQQALKNFDRQVEVRTVIINEFIENNKGLEGDGAYKQSSRKEDVSVATAQINIEDLINFEETSLIKSLKCYETELRHIYYNYATICNNVEIHFTPVLIRMYLWQLYFDCNMHDKGLTFVQIDNIFFKNPAWIARTPHNPFEKIYFWQFLHSLISVATELYAKRHFPGTKPDTILASHLVNGYGSTVPLKSVYALYRSVGEPHTLKLFNFGNLPCKTVIKIFALIFPQLLEKGQIMDLEIEITFYEFFEAFITCVEESIRLKDEELWAEQLALQGDVSPVKMRTKNPMAKKPQQILFSKNLYSPKTKVENWDFATHAETKDNYVYRDKLSNHMSTYNRWGTKDQGTGMTETRHMLAQVFTKTDPVYSFKPLVNFTSYPCTDTPGRNTLMKSANLAQLPPEFGVMDYMSTQQDDYRNPFPCLTMSTPTWLLNRVIRSDLTHNHGTAPPRGDYQCLDTHTPIGHIRQLRLFRYQSFDPATCLQSFPDVKINLNNNKNANDI
ncbi:hypothetical protein MSG28_002307 [Choristoneura fumiferana]|uniref:Uncharacterized protein n=1 Tax=Choristoneura fumiferana TaxID=7141 RepID=A0ACC0JVF4_CHOFU|nr:hypothetical protein MSG28_002307 [Choristoneura fumiferana]